MMKLIIGYLFFNLAIFKKSTPENYASVNSKHQHPPGLTPGEFFKVVKFPAPGQKILAKLRPRGKK